MVLVYEALVGLVVLGVGLWARRLLGGRLAAGLVAALALAFFWPWLLAADWAAVGRAAIVGGVVAGLALGYALLIRRIRRAVRARDAGAAED